MSTPLSECEALMDSASTALGNADYSGAITYATQALAKLAVVMATEHGDRKLTPSGWNADGIRSFIAECRKLQRSASAASSGALQMSKITYARATD